MWLVPVNSSSIPSRKKCGYQSQTWLSSLVFKRCLSFEIAKTLLTRAYRILNNLLLVRTSISLAMFCIHHLRDITLFDVVFHSPTYTLSFISISWYLYSFIPDIMKKSTILIKDVDPVIFQVIDDDVALRIATKTVRLKDSVTCQLHSMIDQWLYLVQKVQ